MSKKRKEQTSSEKKFGVIVLSVAFLGTLLLMLIESSGIDFEVEKINDFVVLGVVVAIIIAVFIASKFINFDKSNDSKIERERQQTGFLKKQKTLAKKQETETRYNRKRLAIASMTYHGGGLIDKSKKVPIVVSEEGLEYGGHFINKENIESVLLDTQANMSTHVKQRITATRMFLLGPFALAAPKSKTSQIETTSKFLGIDYTENGEKYTLILEGERATKIQFALRKMKNI